MSPSPPPAVFSLLAGEPSSAVDAALVHAWPGLDPELRITALDLLIKRGREDALASIIMDFSSRDEALRGEILRRSAGLYGGVRHAIGSGRTEGRLAAVEFIDQSGDAKLAHLLAQALRGRCRRTRQKAAATLSRWTARVIQQCRVSSSGSCEVEHRSEPGNPRGLKPAARYAISDHALGGLDGAAASHSASQHAEDLDGLGEALGDVIRSWELHLDTEVLTAALSLCDRTEVVVKEKLREPRTRIAHAVGSILEGTKNPGLAGFALRALAIPELQPAAVMAIGGARDHSFLSALAAESWLLADPEVERGARRVRQLKWFSEGVEMLLTFDEGERLGLIRLLGAAGVKAEKKADLYRSILALGEDGLDYAVVGQLCVQGRPWSTEVLRTVAQRNRSAAAGMARRELRRRGLEFDLEGETRQPAPGPVTSAGAKDAWDRYLRDFEKLTREERLAIFDQFRQVGFDLLVPLRSKLASAEPIDRVRGLRVLRALRLTDQLDEQVYRLTNDPDGIVRASAVSSLADVPGPTSLRILRRAVDDPDDRVQANAIEALDRLDREEWVEVARSKLDSKNGRIRANAIKVLLINASHEAGDVLLDMLSDSSRTHRLSALWVVEQLDLHSLLKRINQMIREDPDERVRAKAEGVLRSLDGEAGKAAPSAVATSAQAGGVV